MLQATTPIPDPSQDRRQPGVPAETAQLHCLVAEAAAPAVVLDQQPHARLAAGVATAVTDGGPLDTPLVRCTDALAQEHVARVEAEAAKRARDEMLAMVAHDLRNPLAMIQMTSQLLLSDPVPDAEMTRKVLHMMQRAGSRMSRLIGDLLDARQIESGRFVVETHPELPSAVVRDALDLLQPIAASKRQRLDAEIEPGLLAMQVDGARIQQVISNLVGNAIKFSPPDSVITVCAQGRLGAVRISVRNTGPGILPDELPRIFDRYWQGKGRERGGLGLGLAIAKSIVEAHGGCIGISSEPDVATIFYFDIPLFPVRTP
jgi:signal transduction histidine kinase